MASGNLMTSEKTNKGRMWSIDGCPVSRALQEAAWIAQDQAYAVDSD
jgi:hypothetical protein